VAKAMAVAASRTKYFMEVPPCRRCEPSEAIHRFNWIA
jgi:hypothetical protein